MQAPTNMTVARLQIVPSAGTRDSMPTTQWTKKRGWIGYAAVAAAVLVFLGLQAWNAKVRHSAVQNLHDRRAVYARTLATIETTCNAATRPAALDGYCAAQVRFISDFPECGSDCRAAMERTRRLPAPR